VERNALLDRISLIPAALIPLGAFSVPVISADPATETALELVHRLVLTPEVAA
jgi:hypothetical protein